MTPSDPPQTAPDEADKWQRIVEILEPLVNETRRARLHAVLDARLLSVTVVMDAPHDPHNGAAVLRSCDAFGIQNAHVVVRNEPFRASGAVAKGTQQWVDVHNHQVVAAAVNAMRTFELVGTHPQGELQPEDLAQIPRLALVMGNEHDGICEELQQACRRRANRMIRQSL